MDLLRAVIVGAYGTPYQDGLFFFDFHLPPEYPDVPPVRNLPLSLSLSLQLHYSMQESVILDNSGNVNEAKIYVFFSIFWPFTMSHIRSSIHFFKLFVIMMQSAYYHSGGWRINPNLYEEGKVCLSLLNTWTGRGNEVWDPSSSSILQVLVSLQGLVLNSKPYFNEAGYDKQLGTAEGEKNSLSYNENTFLLNCKTMMYLMRRPPKVWDINFLISWSFYMAW